MSRTAKKILYGLVWNGLALLVLVLVYLVWFRPSVSCTDGARNGGEEAVDCGGPCVSCELTNLELLNVFEEPRVFPLASGRAAIWGQVSNPNIQFGADSFSYEFVVRDRTGAVLERIPGVSRIYPFETRSLIAVSSEALARDVAEVELVTSDPAWRSARELPPPSLQVLSDFTMTVAGQSIRVSGSVRNQGGEHVQKVRIIAVLVDRTGTDLLPGQTVVSDLGGFRDLPFVVQLPADAVTALRLDPEATRVVAQAE